MVNKLFLWDTISDVPNILEDYSKHLTSMRDVVIGWQSSYTTWSFSLIYGQVWGVALLFWNLCFSYIKLLFLKYLTLVGAVSRGPQGSRVLCVQLDLMLAWFKFYSLRGTRVFTTIQVLGGNWNLESLRDFRPHPSPVAISSGTSCKDWFVHAPSFPIVSNNKA